MVCVMSSPAAVPWAHFHHYFHVLLLVRCGLFLTLWWFFLNVFFFPAIYAFRINSIFQRLCKVSPWLQDLKWNHPPNKQTNKHQKREVKKYSYQDCGLVNLTISVFSVFVVNSDMYDIQITEYHCLCSVFHLDYQNNKWYFDTRKFDHKITTKGAAVDVRVFCLWRKKSSAIRCVFQYQFP